MLRPQCEGAGRGRGVSRTPPTSPSGPCAPAFTPGPFLRVSAVHPPVLSSGPHQHRKPFCPGGVGGCCQPKTHLQDRRASVLIGVWLGQSEAPSHAFQRLAGLDTLVSPPRKSHAVTESQAPANAKGSGFHSSKSPEKRAGMTGQRAGISGCKRCLSPRRTSVGCRRALGSA